MGCTVWCGGGDTGVYGGGGGAGLTTMSGECSAPPRFFSFGYGGDMGAGGAPSAAGVAEGVGLVEFFDQSGAHGGRGAM